MTAPNDLAIRRAFEAAGVEFIDENGGEPACVFVRPGEKCLENELDPGSARDRGAAAGERLSSALGHQPRTSFLSL